MDDKDLIDGISTLQAGLTTATGLVIVADPKSRDVGNWPQNLESHLPIIPFYKRGCQDKYLLNDGKTVENGLIVQPQ